MNLLGSVRNLFTSAISWFLKASLLVKAIVVIVVLGIIWIGYTRTLGSKSREPQYQTTQVERGTLIVSVSGTGTISSANSVSITTAGAGTITDVYVKNGDSVSAGDKIADLTLDQNSLQRQTLAWSNYLSAQNNLNAAKSKMNSLQSAMFKANQAFVKDAGQPNPDTADPKYIEENADWQQAEADYTNQQGVIDQANTSLSSAWLSYQQISSTITAPASGVISNLTIAPGTSLVNQNTSSTTTNSNAVQSVGTIAIEGGRLQAIVDLSEVDIPNVALGQKVTLTLDAFPDKTFTGKVTAIDTSGTVSSGVTTYPTTITFDNNESKIYPNMAVSAKIITDIKDNVLLVPSSAITSSNGSSTVQVMRNGQPQTVTVTTGEANDTQTEITSGLNEGDTIVTATLTTGSSGATTSPFGGGFGGGALFRAGGGGFGGGGARGGGGGRGGGG